MTEQEAIEIITNAIQTQNLTVERDKALAIIQKAMKRCEPFEVRDIIKQQQETIESQKAEIERLKYQVNQLKKYDKERDIALHSRLIATAKSEAVKEFAEELKEKAHRCDLSTDEHEYYSVGVVEIDILLEKKAGANNG